MKTLGNVLWLVLAVILAAISGCSGDDIAPPSIEDAVRRYTTAFGDGDGETVVSMVSARCLSEVGAATFRDAASTASASYGPLKVTSFDSDLDGDTATVSYSVSEPTLSQTGQTWTLVDGAWRWDNC